ncbi:MAG: glutamate-5-semialdehyde dehydrogenase [Bacillota bacterium]|nr:glutamate-5-semialdehyde dehydrogenase [Bacillota bacterium]
MKAIILAAGYATRLYPLTIDRPKPLLEVGGRPIIDHIVAEIETIPEVDEIIVVTNSRFAAPFEDWAAELGPRVRVPLTVLDDGTDTPENRLGAVGDIYFAIQKLGIDDDLLVIAGDNLFTYPLAPIAASFLEDGRDMILGQELEPEEDPRRFAIAVLAPDGSVLHLEEKPQQPRSNIGVYATYFYRRDTLPLIAEYLDGGGNPDAPGHFPAWLYQRKPVRLHLFDGQAYDIGTHEALARVRAIYEAKTTPALARTARQAARVLATTTSECRNQALAAISEALEADQERILAANRSDCRRAQAEGLAPALLKRLRLDAAGIAGLRAGIASLRALPDPLGKTQLARELDQGLDLYRVTCPLGVIGVIFEARPDALVQIATLCLKSGNAVLLKGGSEARETNLVLADIIRRATAELLPEGWLALLEERRQVRELLELDQDVDLIIPRGSNAFVQQIMRQTAIPVLGHADGVCHLYIDRAADPEMAVQIAVDAKTQYAAVCNAAETLLLDSRLDDGLIVRLLAALTAAGVRLHADEALRARLRAAGEEGGRLAGLCMDVEDWHQEYLDLEISVALVEDDAAAVAHINRYGSGHTDAIVTDDEEAARRFLAAVDAANVFWNCSTRFSDGFRYGFGAEVGIATGRIHARGPVGLEGLVSYRYLVLGSGQTVAPYAAGESKFTHCDRNSEFPLT